MPVNNSGDHSADNVVIDCEPQLNIYESLHEKLLELRSKRDAVLLSHKNLKKKNDAYNKCIIYLSLIAACFETVKAQLGLADRNDFIAPMAILAPIFLTTAVTIISSLLKFKKFPEKMESNTKAAEKCYFAIIRIRQLIENLNFQEEYVSKNAYHTEVMVYYRDALDSIERTIYPKERTALFLQAQKNLIDIQQNEYKYNTGAHHIKCKMVDLEEKRIELNKREKALYEADHIADGDGSTSTSSIFNSRVDEPGGCCAQGCWPKKCCQPPDEETGFDFDDFKHAKSDPAAASSGDDPAADAGADAGGVDAGGADAGGADAASGADAAATLQSIMDSENSNH